MTDTEEDLLPFTEDEKYQYRYEKPVADWLYRLERRRNKYDRLKQLGRFALLGQTSILTGYEDGRVDPLTEESNAKTVFKRSYMFRANKKSTNKAIMALSTDDYKRCEEAFKSFMLTVSLAVEELDDHPTMSCFMALKLWTYRHMAQNPDQVCEYFKWLLKACQILFLGKEIPSPESWFPNLKGCYHPFQTNKLAFIGELFEAKKLNRRLTVDETMIVVQLCNGIRSMPYPSKRQVNQSILKTVEILQEPIKIKAETRQAYKEALVQTGLRLGKPDSRKSHISLTSSACIENAQSKGGKATYMVLQAKRLLQKPAKVEEIRPLEGLKDHLGYTVFHTGISDFIREGTDMIDICYLHPDDAQKYLDKIDITKERVPYDYGRCILLTTSYLLGKEGEFLERVSNPLDLPLFRGKTKFKPNLTSIPTRASLVLEKGMKARVITTTSAAKAQIEQAFSNMVREYLGKDPFHRIGFEEPDKLWSTLKLYQKIKASQAS